MFLSKCTTPRTLNRPQEYWRSQQYGLLGHAREHSLGARQLLARLFRTCRRGMRAINPTDMRTKGRSRVLKPFLLQSHEQFGIGFIGQPVLAVRRRSSSIEIGVPQVEPPIRHVVQGRTETDLRLPKAVGEQLLAFRRGRL